MTDQVRLLIVDDDVNVAVTLQAVLEQEGYHVWAAESGAKAESLINTEEFDVALVDLRLGDADGVEVLKTLRVQQPDCMGIILTGYASLESAVEAIRQGAYDYLVKPCDLDELKLTVRGAAERGAMARAVRVRLEEQASALEEMRALIHELRRDLDSATAELNQRTQELAQAIHYLQEVWHRHDVLPDP
jgi:DNA-binding NtrC family response regulator